MNNDFKPYANESDVIRIGSLEIENRIDRVSITGDVVLTKDQQGLVLAKELRSLVGRVIRALEAEKQLPETVEIKPAQEVENPFEGT
jgi:DNA primase large subunit